MEQRFAWLLARTMKLIASAEVGEVIEVEGLAFEVDEGDKASLHVLKSVNQALDGMSVGNVIHGLENLAFWMKLWGSVSTGEKARDENGGSWTSEIVSKKDVAVREYVFGMLSDGISMKPETPHIIANHMGDDVSPQDVADAVKDYDIDHDTNHYADLEVDDENDV